MRDAIDHYLEACREWHMKPEKQSKSIASYLKTC